MLRFTVQKRLFTEMLQRGFPALVKGTSPSDSGQYTVLSSNGRSLTQITARNELIFKQVIDRAEAEELSASGTWTHVVDGRRLKDVFSMSNAIDKISVEFEPSAVETPAKSAAPNQRPVSHLGNLVIRFPEDETWDQPVVDAESIGLSVNPRIEAGGKHKLVVRAAELAKFVAQVGMSVGKDGGNTSYRNALIRSKGGRYEVVAATPQHLTLAKAKVGEGGASGDFSATVVYGHLSDAVKMLNPDQDVEVIHNAGTPGTLVLCQTVEYGDRTIGNVQISITCTSEPFAKFEKLVSSLDCPNSVRFNAQKMRQVCGQLGIQDDPHNQISINAEKRVMTIKNSCSRGKAKLSVPLSEIKGGDFEAIISNNLMAMSMGNSELEDVEWRFSGKTTLSHMRLVRRTDEQGDEVAILDTYFPPFGGDE